MKPLKKKLLSLTILLFANILMFSQTFDFVADITKGCSPQQVMFTNITDASYINDYRYEWVVEPGKFSTQTESLQNTYISPGVYSPAMKVYDSNNNLIETIVKTNYIKIFKDPDVTIQASRDIACVGTPIDFTVANIDSDAPIESWKWIFSDGTSFTGKDIPSYSFSYASEFTAFVTVQDTNGCINRIRSEITVEVFDDYPSTQFMADKRRVCEPTLDVNFTNSTVPDNVSYSWEFGDGNTSTSKSPSHTFNGYGDYYVKLTATTPISGCSRSSTQVVQLIDYQASIDIYDATKTIDGSNKACLGAIGFTPNVTPAGTVSYLWDMGNDGIDDGTEYGFVSNHDSPGTYMIKLTVNNGICTTTALSTYTVEEPLDISYSPNNEYFCKGPANVTYIASSNIPGTEYTWYLKGETFKGNNISIDYGAGLYSDSVLALSPNNCRATLAKPDNIEVASHFLRIAPQSDVEGCNPLTVEFDTIFSLIARNDFPVKVEWDFNDDGVIDSDQPGPQSFEFKRRGVWPASVIVTTDKGCVFKDSTQQYSIYGEEWVKVGEKPNLDLIFDDTVICASAPNIGGIVRFDDSLLNTEYDYLRIIYSPLVPNSYVTPNDTKTPPSDFASAIRDSIGVHQVYFYLNDHGCDTTIKDTTTEYTYTFPGGGGPAIVDSIMFPTTIRVKGPIIDIGGTGKDCYNNYEYQYFLTKKINLDYSIPGNNLSWYLKKDGFPGRKLVATNIDTLNINYKPDSLGRGKYYIYAIAENINDGCEDSVMWTTLVTDIQTSFTLQDTTVCLGDTAIFILSDTAKDVIGSYWQYEQDSIFKWPILEGEDSLFYVFNSRKITNVKVISFDTFGCEDVVNIPVKVYAPEPFFYADVVSDCIPFKTKYVDTSRSDTTIVSRHWTFGNGDVSNTNDSIFTAQYNSKGFVSPKLVVTDVLGCKDSLSKPNYIKPVIPNSNFKIENPKLCLNHNALIVRDTSDKQLANNLSRFKWDFGDGVTDETTLKDTISHKYIYESMGSVFKVKFVAYSISPEGNECTDSTYNDIEVKDVAAKIAIQSMDACKEPGQKFIVDLDDTWYSSRYKYVNWWKTENGDSTYIGNKPNLDVIFFDEYGEHTLNLVTTTEYYGCENDTTKMNITVPGYVADFVVDKDEVCVGEEITFTLKDTLNINNYEHYFEFGDGTKESVNFDNPTHSYTFLPDNIDNTYKAQFIVKAPGCKTQDISKIINIYPVIADFDRGLNDKSIIGCAPYTVTFYNDSEGSTSNNFTWHFGDGTTSKENNPTHTFNTIDSIYNVSLSIETSVCQHEVVKPITTHPLATIDFDLDSSLCLGSQTNIEATGNFTSIKWSPSQYFEDSNNKNTIVKPPYSLYAKASLVSPFGCPSEDSVYIYVQQYPNYYGAPDSLLQYYFTQDSLKFNRQITSQLIAGQIYNVNNDRVLGVNYNWTPSTYLSCDNCPSPSIDLQCGTIGYSNCIDFPETVSYTITMADTMGCFENEESIMFNIVIETKAALPQAFTPNGDGENDIAFVRGWGIKEFLELQIFNRWGQQVFKTTDITQGWDGTFKGEPQNAETFAYTIKIINTADEEEFIKGYITLIR